MSRKLLLLFQTVVKNKLFSGSLVLLAGATISNIGNYFYHLLAGRMLGPKDYGLLSSLIALTYLMAVPVGTIRLALVKEVSSVGKKSDLVGRMYHWAVNKSILASLILIVVLFVVSPAISTALGIFRPNLVFIMLASGAVGIYVSVNFSFLQGLLEFNKLAVVNILATFVKLTAAVGLMVLGYGVFGATFSFLITTFLLSAITYVLLKKVIKPGRKDGVGPKIKFSSVVLPIFIFNLAHTSLYSMDIVLAKKFLIGQEAGFYAALSTLGKIIFFGVSPIITVMFPIVSKKFSNKGNYRKAFNLSLLLIVGFCSVLSLFYFFFPQFMVSILFGKDYFTIAPYLKYFAIIFSLFALSYFFVNYFISIKKAKPVLFYLAAALAQIIGLSVYNENILQMTFVSLTVVFLLFTSLLGYYLLDERQ